MKTSGPARAQLNINWALRGVQGFPDPAAYLIMPLGDVLEVGIDLEDVNAVSRALTACREIHVQTLVNLLTLHPDRVEFTKDDDGDTIAVITGRAVYDGAYAGLNQTWFWFSWHMETEVVYTTLVSQGRKPITGLAYEGIRQAVGFLSELAHDSELHDLLERLITTAFDEQVETFERLNLLSRIQDVRLNPEVANEYGNFHDETADAAVMLLTAAYINWLSEFSERRRMPGESREEALRKWANHFDTFGGVEAWRVIAD